MLPLIFYSTGLFPKTIDPVSFSTILQPLSHLPISNPYLNQMIMILPSPVLQQNQQKEIEMFTRNTHSTDNTDDIKIQREVQSQNSRDQDKQTKRIQNPNRNVYTNLTNLILNSIVSKKKMSMTLKNVDPTLVGDNLVEFCKYVKSLRSHFSSYFNVQKVKKLFKGTSIPNFNKDFHQIFRKAAKIILEQKIPICLVTSKKLSPVLRQEHLRARRTMMLILKYGNTPYQGY